MNKTVIIIAGPTAVGKTAVAIEIARHFHTAIISADSRQCFRELNIGVAKPSPEHLKAVLHYFINSHSIHEEVSAALFETYALQKAEDLFTEHDIVVMVGGTGLYIKAFCEGMDDMPAADNALRKELQLKYEQEGIGWLADALLTEDPLFAQKGEMQNPQRMLRALEVKRLTGKSMIEYKTGIKKQRPFRIIKIGLDLPRPELYNRINGRVEEMLQAGLENEVKQLIPFQHLNALQTVGYNEFFDYFNGKIRYEKAVDKIQQNTRHYAKRQLTWFRRDVEIKWFFPHRFAEIIEYLQMLKQL
jgi:tRNA dimethylallyltransferase